MPDIDTPPRPQAPEAAPSAIGRRTLVAGLAGGTLALAGGLGLRRLIDRGQDPGGATMHAAAVRLDPAAIARAEAARARSGRTHDVDLVARRGQVDLGGRVVTALTYGGSVPGALVRVSAGDVLRARIRNELDQETSVHWHGLAIRHDADGVPGVTGPAVAAGASTVVEFVVPDPGTYWLHPHTGLQLDWGLHAPVIVDDPHEPGAYDEELVVVLDDWTVGWGKTPEDLLADLQAGGGSGGGMGGMDHGSGGGAGGMQGMPDAGDVAYPAYLANGRLPTAAATFRAAPGRRVRIRMINAAADTTFDVALAGHRLTVTHTDGFPVQQVVVDTLRIAMGERYDVVVALADGVFPLAAVPLGKAGTPARVLLRSGTASAPDAEARPTELTGRRLGPADLAPTDDVRLPDRSPDTVQDVVLAGDMATYRWTINGRTYADAVPLRVREGASARLRISNRSMMSHPVHLHGHTFAVRGSGLRKDTLLVPAMTAVDVDLLADNPGAWMLHCHNAFHMEAGMMTRLDYTV